MCEYVRRPQRELASKLLDVVKVGTVVKEPPSQPFYLLFTRTSTHAKLARVVLMRLTATAIKKKLRLKTNDRRIPSQALNLRSVANVSFQHKARL